MHIFATTVADALNEKWGRLLTMQEADGLVPFVNGANTDGAWARADIPRMRWAATQLRTAPPELQISGLWREVCAGVPCYCSEGYLLNATDPNGWMPDDCHSLTEHGGPWEHQTYGLDARLMLLNDRKYANMTYKQVADVLDVCADLIETLRTTPQETSP